MSKKYYNAFNNHRQNAKKRGIEFHFAYEEWIAWWKQHLGSTWHKKRGFKAGGYVMARNKDKGPYSCNNVSCMLREDNLRDQARNGLSGAKHANGIKITPKEVVEIFHKDGTQKSIALAYGVSERLVRLIKNKKVWCGVLKKQHHLSPPVR